MENIANIEGETLRVEVTGETLIRLLKEGRVCAADFKCLDCRSKDCMRRLCLQSCKKTPRLCARTCKGMYGGRCC